MPIFTSCVKILLEVKQMNREEYMQFLADYTGERPEHPFSDDNDTTVFRHSDNRKWFALVMSVPRRKLGLYGDKSIDVVNLKCDPLLTASLFREGGVFPAYHMNKEKWISVLLDGSVDEDRLRWLSEISFSLTAKKIKRKKPNL